MDEKGKYMGIWWLGKQDRTLGPLCVPVCVCTHSGPLNVDGKEQKKSWAYHVSIPSFGLLYSTLLSTWDQSEINSIQSFLTQFYTVGSLNACVSSENCFLMGHYCDDRYVYSSTAYTSGASTESRIPCFYTHIAGPHTKNRNAEIQQQWNLPVWCLT